MDSDHLPLCLRLQDGTGVVRRKRRTQEDTRYKDITQWDEENVAVYRRKLEQSLDPKETGVSAEKDWRYLKEKVHEAM